MDLLSACWCFIVPRRQCWWQGAIPNPASPCLCLACAPAKACGCTAGHSSCSLSLSLSGNAGRKAPAAFFPFTPWAQLLPHRSKGAAKMQPATTPSFTLLPFYFTSPNGVGGTEQSPALFKGLILEPSMLGSNECFAALRGARSTTVTIPPQGLAHPGASQMLTKASPGQLP